MLLHQFRWTSSLWDLPLFMCNLFARRPFAFSFFFSNKKWTYSFFNQTNHIRISLSHRNTFVVVFIMCKCCKHCQHNCFVCQLPHAQIFTVLRIPVQFRLLHCSLVWLNKGGQEIVFSNIQFQTSAKCCLQWAIIRLTLFQPWISSHKSTVKPKSHFISLTFLLTVGF